MVTGEDVPDLVEEREDCCSDSSMEEDIEDNTNKMQGNGNLDIVEDGKISEDEDWDEPETIQAHCLFCQSISENRIDFLAHLQKSHTFSLAAVIKHHNLDDYGYIKLINFIRKVNPSPEDVSLGTAELWNNLDFLRPVLENDDVLLWDIEDLLTDVKESIVEDSSSISKPASSGLSEGKDADYWRDVAEKSHALIQERDAALSRALQDLKLMKQSVQNLLSGSDETSTDESNGADPSYRPSDEGYFSSYSHFGIHHEMLSDKVRTEAYRDAILNNEKTFAGKKVLDVGCGTGILSMFAAKAGAAAVVGVDMSDVIYNAMGIVRENDLEDKVKLVRSKIEEADLGTPTVDIIISEWMGYFLLFEGMLDSILAARDKFLAPGGIVLPNRCTMSLVAVSDHERYKNTIDFWKDVYGFKMRSMTSEVIRDASIEVIPETSVVSEPFEILDLDIQKCTLAETNFSANFDLVISRDCELTAIGGYFDTFFELENSNWFSTGPKAESTHWKQTVFYLPKKIKVASGQTLSGGIYCRRHSKDTRWLEVTLSIDGMKDILYNIV